MNRNDDFSTVANFYFYLLKIKILNCKHSATPSDVFNDNWSDQNKTEKWKEQKLYKKLTERRETQRNDFRLWNWKIKSEKEIFYVKSRGTIKQTVEFFRQMTDMYWFLVNIALTQIQKITKIFAKTEIRLKNDEDNLIVS